MSARTRRLAELSVFTAAAFIFSYIESLFPLPIPIPGIKLGLANLIILIVLCHNGPGAALGVSMVRNILNALTFGSLFGLFYSFAGSLLSLLAMALLLRGSRTLHDRNKIPPLSLTGISAVGGVLHNIGQFLIAVFLVGFSAILHYLPFLYFAGLFAGILIGILAELCLRRFPSPSSPLREDQRSGDSHTYQEERK